MMIVVKRAETFMSRNLESKSLRDPLDGKVAELLKLDYIPPFPCLGIVRTSSASALGFMKTFILDYTIFFPNGDRASFASRKCIFPKGMPMMVIQPAKDNPDDVS